MPLDEGKYTAMARAIGAVSLPESNTMALGQPTCPRCASMRIHYSRSGNARLMPLMRLLVVCARCYLCERRFYLLRKPFLRLYPPAKPRHKRRAA